MSVPNNLFQFLKLLCFSWHFLRSTLPHSHHFFLFFPKEKKTRFPLLIFFNSSCRCCFIKNIRKFNLGILVRLKAIHSIFCMLSAFVTFYLIEFTIYIYIYIYISMNLFGCCKNFRERKCLGFSFRTSQIEPNTTPFGLVGLRFH